MRLLNRCFVWGLLFILITGVGLMFRAVAAPVAPAGVEPVYHSPFDMSYSPNGKLLGVSDRTAGAVAFIDAASNKVLCQAPVGKRPGMLAWAADSSKVYVSEYETGTVAEVATDGKVARRFDVGAYPMGVAVAGKRGLLLAANTAFHEIRVLNLADGKEKARIPAVREPYYIAISADETTAVVSNLLPGGAASDPQITACVTVIDLEKMQKSADIKLPPNTTSIRQVAISPDGKWAYAVHTVGRTTLPATQLDRGWVNTNAMTVIDLKSKQQFATVLMDNLAEGAADPWGVKLSKDGATMFVTLAGVHQLARIDLAGLHKALSPVPAPQPAAPAPAAGRRSYTTPNVWNEIKLDPSRRADLVNDLAAMYVGGFINRVPLPGKGPRGLDVAPDGTKVAVGMYFTGEILMCDATSGTSAGSIVLGAQPQANAARRGDMIFHDSHHCFQHWLSCATCHPNDGRVDGLNWDLPNDGIGNPKNAKNLLNAQHTPPMMSLGIREDMEHAVAAGFRFQAFQPTPEDAKDAAAYVAAMKADRSPWRLPNGDLSDKAKRGKVIFESKQAECAVCHSGEMFTSMKNYNVGTHGSLDHDGEEAFDTPSLIEVWRTGPYMHDGRAATLEEIFTKYNPEDRHGRTSQLSKEQIGELVEYLKSL